MLCIANKKSKIYIGNKKVKKGYIGNKIYYSSGNIVTYNVDGSSVYKEEVEDGKTCLSPTTFTPSKSGYTFVGWREDKTASSSVLSSKIMSGDPVSLYAVFKKIITLSYNGNGNTGGSTASQTGNQYYNNGSIVNPSFKLNANGFTKTSYTFTKWAMGSTSGTQYSAGATVTLSANTVFYALWQIVYSVSTAKHNGGGFRVGADGHRAIGAGSIRDGGTPDWGISKSLSGNAIVWQYSNNYGTIRALTACTVSIACSFTTRPADGWTWYSYNAQLFKNNASVSTIWAGGEMGGNGQGGQTYSNTVTVSLNAGDTCEVRLAGGHDQDLGDRTGWSWNVTYTATPR